jgi:cytosine/adenosine deaminase-related metal-dependent hydrolase
MMQTHNDDGSERRAATEPLALVGGLVVELQPARVRRADVLIADGRIVSIGGAIPAGTPTIDCADKLIMPGFVCAHTHLYSSLARGMPPPREAPQTFRQILERVWWRLDCALDAETIELSAQVGAIEALRAGCTTLVDHHASPGRRGAAVDGSLDVVADALMRIGARAVLCYETSDRNGVVEARAGLRENERFLARVRGEPPRLVRGMVGAHAAFTLSDETAEALADLAQRTDSGVHIHVAEDGVDARRSDGGGALSTVAWLAERGLLSRRALLAHCVHVDDDDVARIAAAGAHVVHNARSNANNAVGYARPGRFGSQLLLGTDGIGADMRAEIFAAFLDARAHGDGVDLVAALERNRTFAAELFGATAAVAEPESEIHARSRMEQGSMAPMDASRAQAAMTRGLTIAAASTSPTVGANAAADLIVAGKPGAEAGADPAVVAEAGAALTAVAEAGAAPAVASEASADRTMAEEAGADRHVAAEVGTNRTAAAANSGLTIPATGATMDLTAAAGAKVEFAVTVGERAPTPAARDAQGRGPVTVGAVADLIVVDYRAPTPLDERNVVGHLLFGLGAARVLHVLVDGRLVLRDGEVVTVDAARIYARAREAAARLWSRL